MTLRNRVVRRAASGIIAMMVVAGGSLMLGASPAFAYSCGNSSTRTIYNATGVSHVTFKLTWNCSDGHIHWSGTLYDDKCDARSAHLAVLGDPVDVPGVGYGEQWSWSVDASNGCGTHSTFSHSEPNLTGGSGLVEIAVGACSLTCATYTTFDFDNIV